MGPFQHRGWINCLNMRDIPDHSSPCQHYVVVCWVLQTYSNSWFDPFSHFYERVTEFKSLSPVGIYIWLKDECGMFMWMIHVCIAFKLDRRV